MSKFIPFNSIPSDYLGISTYNVIVGDSAYYNDNDSEIKEWLDLHLCHIHGAVINFPDDKTRMMFLLRFE